MKARINYLELPSQDVARSRAFYQSAFDWDFTEFGSTYAATTSDDTDIGIDGDTAQHSKAPLPVIEVDGLDAACEKVEQAGGTITKPIYAFPGGRRFHFADPDGHELGVWERGEA